MPASAQEDNGCREAGRSIPTKVEIGTIPTYNPDMTSPTLSPSERLMAELHHERRALRVDAALTALTAVGLAVGIVAAIRGGAPAAEGSFLAAFVGAGGRAGVVAAVGFFVAYLAGGLPAFWNAAK